MMQLQFITHNQAQLGQIEQIRAALSGGISWIQLRVKGMEYAKILALAEEAKEICDSFGATLIVNDHVEIAREIGASGVHLGKHDCSIKTARKILGSGFIIGATANSAADIREHILNGANYVGLGPLRYTSTKENLSPILGVDGIQRLGKLYRKQIPIIAIGGISVDDIYAISLMQIEGVAVSSAIALSHNPEAAAREFLARIENVGTEMAVAL